MKQPRGGQRVLQIINKGRLLSRMAAPLKKAGTLNEALDVALAAFDESPPESKNQADRIRYWIEGKGKASIESGRDGYVSGSNPALAQQMQARTEQLSDSQIEQNLNHIGPDLMSVCARGNPSKPCREKLVLIDEAIQTGIDNIIRKKGIEASTFGSKGLEQLAQFISRRSRNPSSFYAAYLGGVPQQPETDTAMGIWIVTCEGKWTWEYRLRAGGDATWTDKQNGKGGTGKWVFEANQVRLDWRLERLRKHRGLEAAATHPYRPERRLDVEGRFGAHSLRKANLENLPTISRASSSALRPRSGSS